MTPEDRAVSSQPTAIGRLRAALAGQTSMTLRQPSRIFAIVFDRIGRALLPRRFFEFVRARSPREIAEHIYRFTADQILKTVRRPSRVPEILILNTKRWLFRNLVSPILKRNSTWLPTILTYEELTREAEFFMNQNRPEQAWNLFSKSLPYSRNPKTFFVAAACLIQGLGRKAEALDVLRRGNELRRQLAVEHGVPFDRYRVLTDIWPNQLGHVAVADYVIKQGILEGRPPQDTIFYVPPSEPPNPFFLHQWAPHCRFVTDAKDLPFPESALPALTVDYLGPLQKDGTTVYFWELAAKTYRRWHEEKRKPVLSLSADVQERGWSALESVGVPRDAWFVTLHVREVTSKKHHAGVHNILNAEITDYLLAIEEITRRGGWVIRLGDPTMSKLPSMPNVIDYCHSAIKADWMDIFLCANSRFLLGTSSGPAYIPQLYGVPAVLTNWWPPAQRPWHFGDIFLPKLYRSRRGDRYLTLKDSLAEPLGYCNSIDYLYTIQDVAVETNSPDDILAATVEMLDRLAGTVHYDTEDFGLRARAETIYELNSAFGNANLARDFIKKRKFLLD